MIREINFAISNICNAKCIYCPKPEIKSGREKFMDPELVEKVISQKGNFPHWVHSNMGENGEPFLNPFAIDILRIAREAELGLSIFSNFSWLDEVIAYDIIHENLLDTIHVNIDGFTEESYRAVKGLSLKEVLYNVRFFVKLRNELGSPIRVVIHIITHRTYTEAVKQRFGRPALKDKGIIWPQDEEMIKAECELFLDPKKDYVGADDLVFFAERGGPNLAGYHPPSCPQLEKIKSTLFINPDGDVYLCCFDFENRLKIGNVHKETLLQIAEGQLRGSIIEMLEKKVFQQIGSPCNRVDCCQGYSLNERKAG